MRVHQDADDLHVTASCRWLECCSNRNLGTSDSVIGSTIDSDKVALVEIVEWAIQVHHCSHFRFPPVASVQAPKSHLFINEFKLIHYVRIDRPSDHRISWRFWFTLSSRLHCRRLSNTIKMVHSVLSIDRTKRTLRPYWPCLYGISRRRPNDGNRLCPFHSGFPLWKSTCSMDQDENESILAKFAFQFNLSIFQC